MKFCPELGLEKKPETGLVLELGTEFLGSITITIAIIENVIANHTVSTILIA